MYSNPLIKNMQIGGAFCNLGWSFDCVNHEILLAKLNYYQGTGKKMVQILSNRWKTDNN